LSGSQPKAPGSAGGYLLEPLSNSGPIFSFYGDDFTGSTDALESLSISGVPCVLFLGVPEGRVLASFRHYRAVGPAGESRSQSPEWMSSNLPAAFGWSKDLGAPIVQYKVCSTFDSSPEIGSVGRALEIGQDVFGSRCVPVVVAAPRLKRYVLFGNLFAADGSTIYRIDRHPSMRNHPVTPMRESDLRLHLARQTRQRIALIDILALNSSDADRSYDTILRESPDVVIFDGLDDRSLRESARLIWTGRQTSPLFAVGSSGLTFGLIDYWRSAGALVPEALEHKAAKTDRLIVVSGSCSPVTERQIRWALKCGFAGMRLDVAQLASADGINDARESVPAQALNHLQQGRSVVLYTALGPSDCGRTELREELGTQLGILLRDLLRRSGVKRAVIAGGDTCSHAGKQLGVHALTLQAPLEPGVPLCCAHTEEAALQGLELVFKGGQVGPDQFFETVLRGRR
jgi:uncharacterized protein YgbK (DUF1537 family)